MEASEIGTLDVSESTWGATCQTWSSSGAWHSERSWQAQALTWTDSNAWGGRQCWWSECNGYVSAALTDRANGGEEFDSRELVPSVPVGDSLEPGPQDETHAMSGARDGQDFSQKPMESCQYSREELLTFRSQCLIVHEPMLGLPTLADRPAPNPQEAIVGVRKREYRVNPETGDVCSFGEVRRRYEGGYSAVEIAAYWRDKCIPIGGEGRENISSRGSATYSREEMIQMRLPVAAATDRLGFSTLEIPSSWATEVVEQDSKPSQMTPAARVKGEVGEHEAHFERSESSAVRFAQRERSSSRPPRHVAQPCQGSYAAASRARTSCLWVGPLPLPPSKEADFRELSMLLDGFWIYNIEMHRQFAYITVPESQAWDVRVCITNRTIRNGPRLSARERMDSCEFHPTQISPLDVVFSQPEIADIFRNECPLDEAVREVEVQRLSEGWSILAPPFAPIKVVPDGHRYVALDNRRLYVLQRRAVELWPRPCVADMLLAHGPAPSEFWAKLATRGPGDSINVLSAVTSGASQHQRWVDVTKWRRSWCCEAAIAEAEIRRAALAERRARDHDWKGKGHGEPVRGGKRWLDSSQPPVDWASTAWPRQWGRDSPAASVTRREWHPRSEAPRSHSCEPARDAEVPLDAEGEVDRNAQVTEAEGCFDGAHGPPHAEVAEGHSGGEFALQDVGAASSGQATGVDVVSDANVVHSGRADAPHGEQASCAHAATSDEELRVDPDTGRAVTFGEFRALYIGQYSENEMKSYWQDACTLIASALPVSLVPALED